MHVLIRAGGHQRTPRLWQEHPGGAAAGTPHQQQPQYCHRVHRRFLSALPGADGWMKPRIRGLDQGQGCSEGVSIVGD